MFKRMKEMHENGEQGNQFSILSYSHDDTFHSPYRKDGGLFLFTATTLLHYRAMRCHHWNRSMVVSFRYTPFFSFFHSDFHTIFFSFFNDLGIFEMNHKINGNQIKYQILFILLKIHK